MMHASAGCRLGCIAAGKARPPARSASVSRALVFPFESLPTLVLASLSLRIAETVHANAIGMPQATLFGAGLGNDVRSLLRFGFVFLLGALLLALIPSAR